MVKNVKEGTWWVELSVLNVKYQRSVAKHWANGLTDKRNVLLTCRIISPRAPHAFDREFLCLNCLYSQMGFLSSKRSQRCSTWTSAKSEQKSACSSRRLSGPCWSTRKFTKPGMIRSRKSEIRSLVNRCWGVGAESAPRSRTAKA